MRSFSVHTLFVMAAAALLSSSLVYAAPTQSSVPSSGGSASGGATQSTKFVAVDWSGQSGLNILKWHPEREDGLRTASVEYKGERGLLKCTSYFDQYEIEFSVLHDLDSLPGFTEYAAVPRRLEMFQTDDHYHCLILEMIRGYSLREYAPLLKGDYKDVFASRLAGLMSSAIYAMHKIRNVHGNITPDNIYIRPKEDDPDNFEVVFTGFDAAQSIRDPRQPSAIKSHGFAPPEDYIQSSVNQYKRDAWMLGATLYFVTNGMAPYNFDDSSEHGAFAPVPKELQRKMEEIEATDKNTFPEVNTQNGRLRQEIERFLTPKPENRDNVKRFTEERDTDLFNYKPKNPAWAETWNKLKAKLLLNKKPEWHDIPPPDNRWSPNVSTQNTAA
ncbi:kinase-like domain-containing protein [Thamnocephalis sphaerospora]|uniref:Kinase-like domain-containing protein n=1 Tax=Thamnocephalis sphaerospora TaxID=78915 RepID=A0A4P9XT04_9FUNG|nr:kinase-like domain-containing protein [Thamnocephalis sphaerospora]|eukprot:RKP09284.1 kinase-like domain-containing protein [Thamnocephalis sphaerospora]